MIHLGVIGAGAWGLNLIRNIALCPRTDLSAVCDPDETARRAVAESYRSTTTVASPDELWKVPALDAVVVATPPHLHFAQAKEGLERGYHVLVEKPLSTTSRDAAELVRLAEARGLVLMAGHTFLYNNLVNEVKRRIDAGELGEVRYLYSERLNLGRVRGDVDALWNLAPHDISIANHLLGARPGSVNCRGVSYVQTHRDLADVCFFQMDYPGGRLVSGHVSWLDPQKSRRMVVVGSERMLIYDDMDPARHIQIYDKSVAVDFQSPTRDFADFTTRLRAGDLVIPNIRLKEPLFAEIEHFAECIRDGRQPLSGGSAGVEVVCVLEALAESMRRHGMGIDVYYDPMATSTRPSANAPCVAAL